jgi:hypothetical protein
MLRYETPLDCGGTQPRLAAPGTRTRATSTSTGIVHHQITPDHSPQWQWTFGTEH